MKLQLDDVCLHDKCKPFSSEDYTETEVEEIVDEMFRIAVENNGIGLAANQVGLDKRLFIINMPTRKEAFFNPRWEPADFHPGGVIMDTSQFDSMTNSREGCLSLPGIEVTVPRQKVIKASWQDIDGAEVMETLYGIEAIVFQHELDHLNGVLITDYIKQM